MASNASIPALIVSRSESTHNLEDGVPFAYENLHVGETYLKLDKTLFRITPDAKKGPPLEGDVITVLSKQGGRLVLERDYSYVSKGGTAVRRFEVEAMKLVAKRTSVPLPEVIYSLISGCSGEIGMTTIPGTTLESLWDKLNSETKKSICHETWDQIAKLREIPQPPALKQFFQCLADGSPTLDPLIEDLDRCGTPLYTDEDVRARIYHRYLHFGGLRYKNELPDMLPRSSRTVFTHADIAPRNIMVDDHYHITGILDWEYAGWYPDYWEYAQIMRPACQTGDWQKWMDLTAPRKWDISGIAAARRILF
ncbi:phosphotransferase [Coccidioides immitis RS]|uniref:Phosphotransferase n=1 Tax=Coccidioides immitis (strain RS) TaxID=246410 RepID=J3K6U5_COCIM|nr:phosphotransferase [Coccidioides immitis RS]EAS30335.3 phosphotransferase [Coccidioides immitis RS]